LSFDIALSDKTEIHLFIALLLFQTIKSAFLKLKKCNTVKNLLKMYEDKKLCCHSFISSLKHLIFAQNLEELWSLKA
jgi:hypothetical protein